MRVWQMAGLGLMAALPVWGQSAGGSGQASNAPKEVIANGGLIHTLLAAPVTNAPYSAVQVTHTKQTLADGTTISHKGHHAVARDSQGRVRVERRLANGQNGAPDTVMVFVLDPVARTMTTWIAGEKANKVATMVKLPPEKHDGEKKAVVQTSAREAGRPQPVVTTEDLGTESLDGLPVTVVKTTTIVPAGRAGNDAPITKTHEMWTSAEMKLVLKEQWEDPRSGERTVELDEFSRAEPDKAMFHAPAGYAVKDVMQSLKELEDKLAEQQ